MTNPIINSLKTKRWYKDGNLHREDGPAVEFFDGFKVWYREGKRHREDGAAVEFSDGTKVWFYKGKQIYCNSQKEFEQLIKLIGFL